MQLGKHLFWTNLHIPFIEDNVSRFHAAGIEALAENRGYDLADLTGVEDKRLALRNTVEPALGKYLFDFALNPTKTTALF